MPGRILNGERGLDELTTALGNYAPPVAPSLVELRRADNHAQLLCNRHDANACKRRNDKEPEVVESVEDALAGLRIYKGERI